MKLVLLSANSSLSYCLSAFFAIAKPKSAIAKHLFSIAKNKFAVAKLLFAIANSE